MVLALKLSKELLKKKNQTPDSSLDQLSQKLCEDMPWTFPGDFNAQAKLRTLLGTFEHSLNSHLLSLTQCLGYVELQRTEDPSNQ